MLIQNKPKTNLSEEGLFPPCLNGSALENITSVLESISSETTNLFGSISTEGNINNNLAKHGKGQNQNKQ